MKMYNQNPVAGMLTRDPASILYKSTAGHYRPVRVADGPITTHCRFIKNAYWGPAEPKYALPVNFYQQPGSNNLIG